MDTGIDLPFDELAGWWQHDAAAVVPAICLGGLLLAAVTLWGLNVADKSGLSPQHKNIFARAFAGLMAGVFVWLAAQRLRREQAEREILAREDRAILGGDDEAQTS